MRYTNNPTGTKHRSGQEAAKTRLPQASWEMLGSLNSGRIIPVRVQQTDRYVKHAAGLPFRSAFAVYAYVVENAIGRVHEKSEASRIIRGNFRAVSAAADLVYYLAEKSVAGMHSIKREQDGRVEECFVDAGERERGIAFLRQWIARRYPHIVFAAVLGFVALVVCRVDMS